MTHVNHATTLLPPNNLQAVVVFTEKTTGIFRRGLSHERPVLLGVTAAPQTKVRLQYPTK